MDTLINILTLVGSLGIFLYGMKTMSEALQKVSGTGLRNTMARMTSNRYKSVLTGFLITGLIQSSSATTVMTVSFVNAGLLSLFESIGLIMGANIGTTVTAWLITFVGFNLAISIIVLPLVGLSFPLIFAKNNTRGSIGEFIIGFALIILGLEFMKSTIPDINTNPDILEFVFNYTGRGFLSILLFLLVGAIITILIQSSTAAIALTLVMCYKGWIHFDLAAAMILGENIGTTITANFAALITNNAGKRAALSHFFFNLAGVVWMLIIYKVFLNLVDLAVTGAGFSSPYEEVRSIPLALSIFHTSFNLINTVLLIGFIPRVEWLMNRIIPYKQPEPEIFRLKHLKTGILSTSELSLLQARKELTIYARRAKKMFGLVRTLFNEVNTERFELTYNRIANYEEISDRMELEIATYLTKLSEGEISQAGVRKVRIMLKIVDEIESVADASYNIAKGIRRKKQQKIWFSQDLRNNLNEMFNLLNQAFEAMIVNVDTDYKNIAPEKAFNIERKINQLRNRLKQEHLKNIENKNYKYQAGVVYNDILTECEQLGDYLQNVTKAVVESNN